MPSHEQLISNYNIGFLCTELQVQQGRGDKVALRWISSSNSVTDFTFHDLAQASSRYANVYSELGVCAGDKILFLIPRSPDLYFAFLGALKIQANCSILFSNVGEETIKDRIIDTNIRYIVTKENYREKVNYLLKSLHEPIIVFYIDGNETSSANIIGIQQKLTLAKSVFQTPDTKIDTPSLFHFTSGSTGKPKGVQHVHGSYISQLASFREVMQPGEEDIYWCTADPGWVTGTSYGIIGPWVNGTTQIQYGGNFIAKNWMEILQNYKINIWYSAPTVFRMLMQNSDEFYKAYDYSALKRIYCVGEPLNPVILEWGRRIFGKDIYDTWFQTETGSIMIANRPGMDVYPGSMGKPLPQIEARILDDLGNVQNLLQDGNLTIKTPWSSMFVTYINHQDVYNEKFKNEFYYSGDLAQVDQNGYFWFKGRNDDIINTAGHLVSPFEVESAILELSEVADVGVIGISDDILYQKVVAFVVLAPGYEFDKSIDLKIKMHVSRNVSSIASPRELRPVDQIPKTKSGKIMRRVLRSWITGEDLGDLSTMEEMK